MDTYISKASLIFTEDPDQFMGSLIPFLNVLDIRGLYLVSKRFNEVLKKYHRALIDQFITIRKVTRNGKKEYRKFYYGSGIIEMVNEYTEHPSIEITYPSGLKKRFCVYLSVQNLHLYESFKGVRKTMKVDGRNVVLVEKDTLSGEYQYNDKLDEILIEKSGVEFLFCKNKLMRMSKDILDSHHFRWVINYNTLGEMTEISFMIPM